MKKRTFFNCSKIMIIVIFSILICLLIYQFIENMPVYEYPPGRDTKDIFGNGKYQIIRGPAGSRYSLSCYDSLEYIDRNVYKYREIKPYVYTIGSEGYTVLNYETDEIVQEKELKNLPYEYQNIFEQTKKFNSLG